MDSLDAFAIVVEQQSLNKAALQLHLSQPALSRKISGLEQELGVALFERRGKRLVLTPAGQLCYEHALEMRKSRRGFMERIGGYTSVGLAVGSLNIGASLTTLQSTFPDLVTLFVREHPRTDIKAITGKTHEIVKLVTDNQADIGLVASRVDHSGLTCIPLFDDSLSLVIPMAHALAGKKEVEVGDLNKLPMILFSRGTWYRILMDELFQRYSVFPELKMEIDSFEAILRLVATCHTATLLPKSYLRSSVLSQGGLAARDIPGLSATVRTTSIVFTDTALRHPPVQQFVDVATAAFGQSKI
jgi:DNA-binding transcriptional LysR family regulator